MAQCERKSLPSRLIAALGIAVFLASPLTTRAAGTTTTAAQVVQFYSDADTGAWLQLDPAVAVENINNCSLHVGANWFRFTNMNTETGKKTFTMIQMAFSMRQKITVFVTGTTCTGGGTTGYNPATYVRVNRADNP